MTFKYFASLYWQNMKNTVILSAGSGLVLFLIPIVSIGFAFLLPPVYFAIITGVLVAYAVNALIVAPIIALIKTAIDCCTRKFTPENEIPDLVLALELAKEEQITKLSAGLLKYNPLSDSSRVLKRHLYKLQYEEEKEIVEDYTKEKKRLIEDQLGNLPSFIKEKLLKEVVLDHEHQKSFEDFEKNTLKAKAKTLRTKTVEESRKLLVNYIKDDNNNGKKLFQLTQSFFKVARRNSYNGKSTQAPELPPRRSL